MLHEKFRRWSAIGTMPESNLRQASVPEGARWIVPDRGTAPGLIVELDGGVRLYAVPGVPDEMREMVGGTIVPELRALAGGDVIASQVLRVAGLGESAVAERLADLFAAAENPTIAYLASMGEVKVRLTAKAPSEAEARALLAPLAAEVGARLGDLVFTDDDESLEATVLRLLGETGSHAGVRGVADRRRRGAAADVGAGRVGVVPRVGGRLHGGREATRARRARTRRSPAARSRAACALAMAEGALRVFEADVALALTGAAGPEPHDGAAAGHDLGRARRGRRHAARAWVRGARRARPRAPLGRAGGPRSGAPLPGGRAAAGDVAARRHERAGAAEALRRRRGGGVDRRGCGRRSGPCRVSA